ncbi:MAG: SDR family oxidoreductase [Ketobacteraceae bacterium]|nr:SDR family oxidoreductase [Ketobacteraceae bacterium]
MKTVVITGANRGIGLEFVRQYQEEGWKVIAGCRSPESAAELNKLQAKGNLTVLPVDVSNNVSRRNFSKAIGDQAIHLFINNAGIYGPKTALLGNIDEEAWLDVFRVNTIAPLKMVELFHQNLMAAESSTVAILSSKMGSIDDNGSGGVYIYRSSKAAVNAVAKSLAIDLESDQIKVVALHPGWVQTEMGGPDALIDTRTSVGGMRRVIKQLTKGQSGSFISYDGTLIPW